MTDGTRALCAKYAVAGPGALLAARLVLAAEREWECVIQWSDDVSAANGVALREAEDDCYAARLALSEYLDSAEGLSRSRRQVLELVLRDPRRSFFGSLGAS